MDRRTFLGEALAAAGLLSVRGAAAAETGAPAGRAATDELNVVDFGARGDGVSDDSAAFQRALDAAYDARSPSVASRGGRVVVPYSSAGYRVAGLRLRSYVELVGLGGQVWLKNATSLDTILGHGADNSADRVLRKTRIANFLIQGTERSGSGVALLEHADNVIERVRIKGHGGDGVRAEKAAGGAKSDGLAIDNVWIDDNRGCGLRLGPNSHYCQVRGASRISNNDGGNILARGATFAMFGGVVGSTRASAAVLLEGTNGGGFFATEFEATPSQVAPGALLRLGSAGAGRAVGTVIDGCTFTASGNPAPVVLVDVANARNVSLRGGLFDANSAADVVGIRVARDAGPVVVDNVYLGGNIGGGRFLPVDDRSGRLILR